MENASKALIIAGAILLAILIISLGIMIFSQASGVVDSNAMDEVAVTTFNSKFEQYAGDNVRGANVNALISTVVQNNLTNSGDTSKQVKVTFNGTAKNEITSKSQVVALTGKSYSVKTEQDDKSGYTTLITIQVLESR